MNISDIRKQKTRIEMFVVLSFVGLAVAFIFFFVSPYVGFILFLAGMLSLAYFQSQFKKLSINFKENYVTKILEELVPDCSYFPQKGIEKDIVYGSKILHREDRFHTEDRLEGKILGRKFISADVHLQDVRSNGKSTTVVTVFKGRFFIIDSLKPYENEIYIMPNHTFLFAIGEGLKKIDLEFIEFNKRFDVFSKDELPAFALLKPRFMERLLEFSSVGKRVMFGFKDHTIYVALDTRKDAFDFKFMSEINESFFNEIKDEIKLVEELISLLA